MLVRVLLEQSWVLNFYKKKKVFFIDHVRKYTASKISLGVFNPIAFRNLSTYWNIENQMKSLKIFLDDFEKEFNTKIFKYRSILKKLNSEYEQNNWSLSSVSHKFSNYISDINTNYRSINAPYGFGLVNHSGLVNISKMINLFNEKINNLNIFQDEKFEHDKIIFDGNTFKYKKIKFKKIIFCEGYRALENPFFSYLPLIKCKGEIISVETSSLNIDKIIKSSIFFIPIKNNFFRVGSTYNWSDFNERITKNAKKILSDKLDNLIKIPYKITEHVAAIRPTVKDRRPLIGSHPKYKNIFIFNGLGVRGVLNSSYAADQLISFLEKNEPLNSAIDIARFKYS